ncbi:MAG: hypothetical protein ACRDPB_10610 [Nocardioidaceae bacterium]
MPRSAVAAVAAALIALIALAAVPSAVAHRRGAPAYRHVALPTHPCRYEDSPGPCVWDAGLRGNGHGASFWRDAHSHLHYVDNARQRRDGWHPAHSRCHYDTTQPEPRVCQYPFTYFGGWKRVSTAMSDALAEGQYGPGASQRDWTRCIELVRHRTFVVCPDGFRIRLK